MVSVAIRAAKALPISLAVALAAVSGPVPASAQSSASRASSWVVNVQQVTEGTDQVSFALTLDPRLGSHSAVNTDPSKPAVLLLGAARGRGLTNTLSNFRGLVRSIDFDPTDTGVAVRFVTAAPAKVVAEPAGPNRLMVTVTRLTGAEAVGSRPVGSEDDALATAHVLPPALQPLPGEDGFELVMLKYADVSEIVGLLTDGVTVKPNNVFIRREPGFGSMANSQTSYNTNQNQVPQEQQPLGESVDSGLAIDRRLNAIWIKGSPERIAWVKRQIEKIDVPVDSVILETQFVELTEQGARNVGIDLANANGQLGVGNISRGGFLPPGAFDFSLTRNLVSGALQAAIYAQVSKGNGRIVSTPRIAAQSGSTAKILTGDALPILTSITLSGVNGVSQQVQYVNVGVTLQIAPRVSSDGYVTSHIYGVVSSVTGYSQGYPTISQREAETSASVRDGETFVIGGLTQDNALMSQTRVPILGDVPLLGQLFRTNKNNTAKTELYIVITPHIVRHRRSGLFDQQSPPPPADIGGAAILPPPPPPPRPSTTQR